MRSGVLTAQLTTTSTCRTTGFSKPCGAYPIQIDPHHAAERRIVCRFRDPSQIPDDLSGVDEIVLPLHAIGATAGASVELPRGIFGRSAEMLEALHTLRRQDVSAAWAGTPDGIALARQADMTVTAGYGSNIFNTISLARYEALGVTKALLSAELHRKQAEALGGALPRGIFAYGRLPLMLTRNCPVRNKRTCADCRQNGTLTDRKQTQFPIECGSGCSELLNSRPVVLSDRLQTLSNVDFLYLHFTTETKAEAADVLELYRTGGAPQGDFTRGLLFRGVE